MLSSENWLAVTELPRRGAEKIGRVAARSNRHNTAQSQHAQSPCPDKGL